jgi:hypothetical protein
MICLFDIIPTNNAQCQVHFVETVNIMLFVFLWEHILVSNMYCVVFLFYLSSSCVPYVASFSGLSSFDCSFELSNVYLGQMHTTHITSLKQPLFIEVRVASM